MFYDGLKRNRWTGTEAERTRCIDGLTRIRERFHFWDQGWRIVETTGTPVATADLKGKWPPARDLNQRVLLATWNIREFELVSGKGGPRLEESFYYIAELLDHFDIIAVQEVRHDLRALRRVMGLLGRHWDALITDTNKESPGNNERIVFLFDTRKVSPTGVVGEFVLPRESKALQLARSPQIATFRVGWTTFSLVSVHILWGSKKDEENLPARTDEVANLARYLVERSSAAKDARETGGFVDEFENLILLGDFNIFKHTSDAMTALLDAGFGLPPEHHSLPPTNLAGGRYYDQMVVHSSGHRFGFSGRAGVIDWSECVFRPEDIDTYKKYVDASSFGSIQSWGDQAKYNQWRSYQASDHLILWTELIADHADDYLARVRAEQA